MSTVPLDPPAKKRRRPALACEQCRRRKVRCDRASPCNHCSKSSTLEQCTYVPIHVPKQKRALPPGPATTVGPVSILPAPAPTPPHSQCSTGNFLPVPTSSSTPVTVSESGVSDVHALGQRFEGVALATGQTSSSTSERIVGQAIEAVNTTDSIPKTRYYGRSHWMNGLSLLPAGFENLVNPKSTTSNLHSLLSQCKILGRRIKESRLQSTSSTNPLDVPRSTADSFLEHYVSNFEPVFPILHIPSFKADYDRYWNDPNQVSTVFRVQLQLVLALGSCLFDDTFTFRNRASRWVNEAQLWLLTPPEKSRMTIPGIQIMILLTLARSVCGAGQDTVWVLTGLLLRTAMYMGLHRDPSKIGDGEMTVFRAEMRRRLWLSILELNLQSAYDAGGAPLISSDDYDTLPPADLDDNSLTNEPGDSTLGGRADGGSTRLSAALALAHSLPLRLKILRHANDFRARDSYSETLRLNSELVQACHQLSKTLERLSCSPSRAITQFYASLAELLAYRCFHTLHQPVIMRLMSDPKYYFSQKMYIDGALKIAHISGLDWAQGTNENNETRPSPMTALHTKDIAANERLSPSNDNRNDAQTSGNNTKTLQMPCSPASSLMVPECS
ncbi:hypothetical protein CEP54_011602 [Fusarium duplospermum]|uniref:Zn(2)-C6 fungal-type domain-containing protein n=1 Tax=Fusarium duplospermum TaxID=1325734 RepID=A0A428PDG4_9HYPO|nr:hypothetical protein CEP54_011602 [Fusarium duplospermum]